MLVVLGHFCLTTQEYGAQGVAAPVQYLVQIGQTGVDIFFCISGFVMMVVATREGVVKLDPIEFIARRLIRIVPVYWLVSFALLLLVLAANIPKFGFAKTISLPVLNPTFLLESLVLWPTRNPANGVNMPFLAQGWTLSYELYFYLCFAFIAWRLRQPPLVAAALLVIMTGVSFALTSFSTQTPGTAARFFADSIFLEFVLGATIFVVLQYMRAGGAMLLVLGIAALLAMAETNLPRPAVWGLPAAAILYGIVATEGKLSYPRVLISIGDASYSLYLTHGLFTYLYGGLLRRGWFASPALQDFAIVAGTVLAIAASIVAYRIAEKPITERLYRLLALYRWQRSRTEPAITTNHPTTL